MGRKKKADSWKKTSVNKSSINYTVDYEKPYMMKVEFIGTQDEYMEVETVLASILRTMDMKRISKVKTDDGYMVSFKKHNYKSQGFSL